MTLYVCDRCKKQLSRTVNTDKYEVTKCVNYEKWSGRSTLKFCQKCQEDLNDMLDHFINDNQPTCTENLLATDDFEDERTDTFTFKDYRHESTSFAYGSDF